MELLYVAYNYVVIYIYIMYANYRPILIFIYTVYRETVILSL